jgi:ATP-dependent DNA helicase DinG
VESDWDEDLDDVTPDSGAARQAGDDAVEALAKVTAGMASGEQRPEQQEMCRAVGETLVTGTHLVVQAGTGTGKSLAYLVPALLSGKKVVVATATKALQDQLAEKDLPLVERGLGQAFSYAVLKGRSNYICRQRVGEVGSGGIQPELGGDSVEPSRSSPWAPRPRVRPPAWSMKCAPCWPGRRARPAVTGPI